MNFIVSGIHTGIGKTICSAILCEALGYDYWKPVQAGELENTDSHKIKMLTSNSETFPERHSLHIAASPHFAASEENLEIILEEFELPISEKGIIVETAGGILSPLSDKISNLDLMNRLKLPNILICNNYLGSINHSMLTLKLLEQTNLDTVGIVFCGQEVKSTRQYIMDHTSIPILCSVPQFDEMSVTAIRQYANQISPQLKHKLHVK